MSDGFEGARCFWYDSTVVAAGGETPLPVYLDSFRLAIGFIVNMKTVFGGC
jgi:hypothetical protein